MLASFLSLLAFCGLVMATFGLGRPIAYGLHVGDEDWLAMVVWSLGLGLIAAGMLTLGLGLLGLLYAPLLGVLAVIACFCGIGSILVVDLREAQQWGLRKGARSGASPHNWLNTATDSTLATAVETADDSPLARPARWLLRGILLAAAVACFGALIGALAPPTAGDALGYHLELPKRFLLEHQIVFLPYHDNATFPLLTEMWYVWGLAVDGGVCAQLIHWGLGVLLALATVILARPILGKHWAWVGGSVVLLIPGVNHQMTAPLNDIALAVMTTLAMAAWWRAVVNEEQGSWFYVVGLTAGAALGTKYLAMVFGAAVVATWLVVFLRTPDRVRPMLRGIAVATLVATVVAAPWYARAVQHRGYLDIPLLDEVFHPMQSVASGDETWAAGRSSLGWSPLQMATSPWRVTMQPEHFGGRGHQLGILLLATMPGLLFCRRLRSLSLLLGVCGVYYVAWYLLCQNVRFLLPIVPLLSVATVWVWVEMRRLPPWPRVTATAAFVAIVTVMAIVPMVRSRDKIAVAVGEETRDTYLARVEPTYRAALVANDMLGPDAHILSQDDCGFYFEGRFTRERTFRRETEYDRYLTDPAMLSRRLQDDPAQFTHLLLIETVNEPDHEPDDELSDAPTNRKPSRRNPEVNDGNRGVHDPTLSRLAAAQWATRKADDLLTLTDYTHRNTDGLLQRYRLVMLCDLPSMHRSRGSISGVAEGNHREPQFSGVMAWTIAAPRSEPK